MIDVEVPQLTAALRSRSSSYGRLDAVGKRDVPTRKTGQVHRRAHLYPLWPSAEVYMNGLLRH